MGICPRGAAVGDLVCIVKGAYVPLIIRGIRSEQCQDRKYIFEKLLFVGDTYLDGIINGEAYDESKFQRCELV